MRLHTHYRAYTVAQSCMQADVCLWIKALRLLYAFAKWIAGPLVAAFLVVLGQYLLKRRDEKRAERKRLSDQLYVPFRRQLAGAEKSIRLFQRPLTVNPETWTTPRDAGITDKLDRRLRAQLATLYEDTLPNYDKAWNALNEEMRTLGEGWDAKYCDLPDYAHAQEHHIVPIIWWDFLTGDKPCTPIDGLRDGDVLRIWNRFMTPSRFKLLDQSPEQFLIQRWEEAKRNPAMRHYKEYRERALAEIPKAVTMLDRIVVL